MQGKTLTYKIPYFMGSCRETLKSNYAESSALKYIRARWYAPHKTNKRLLPAVALGESWGHRPSGMDRPQTICICLLDEAKNPKLSCGEGARRAEKAHKCHIRLSTAECPARRGINAALGRCSSTTTAAERGSGWQGWQRICLTLGFSVFT